MATLDNAVLALAALAYFASLGLYVVEHKRLRELPRYLPLATAIAGFALHSLFHVLQGVGVGVVSPYSVSYGVSGYAWVIMLGFLLMHLRWSIDALGVLALPLPTLLLFYSLVAADVAPAFVSESRGLALTAHMLLMSFAYAAYSLAFVMAVSYLAVNRALKQKRLHVLDVAYPPLQTLDSLERAFLWVGFPLATLGILAGGTLWLTHWEHLDRNRFLTKELFAIGLWVLYGSLIYSGQRLKLKAKHRAYGAICGFVAVVATLIATSHRFGG